MYIKEYKRSCSHAIAKLTGKLLQNREAGLHSTSIFLDLSKAFNTLDHAVLLMELERYGIRGISNSWFASYLQGRTLRAKIQTKPGETTYSKDFDITYSTAQGSYLGPLLFIIFCNDVQLLPLYGGLILFADDITLTNSHCNVNFLEYSLTYDIGLLMYWFCANKLSLNLNETVIMQFSPGKKKIKASMDGYEIPSVESTRFLGVLLDNTLTWSQHALWLTAKLNVNMHFLSISKNLLPKSCLQSIYFSHFHSHLSYGLLVWCSSLSKKNLLDLYKIQWSCMRIIAGKSQRQSLEYDFKVQKIPSISDMIRIQVMKFGLEVTKQTQPQPVQNMMEAYSGKKMHRYPTHGKSTPNIQKHRSEQFEFPVQIYC